MSRIFRIAEMYHHHDNDVADALTTTVAGYTASPVAASLVIPVTHGYVAKTSDTGGGEACSLADGKPGQILQVTLIVAGGAVTITPTRLTGFATIVLTAQSDFVTLLYVDDIIGWVIFGMGGAAATPVLS